MLEKRRFQSHVEGSVAAVGDSLARWLSPTPTALLVASAVLPKDESVDMVALLLDMGGVGCLRGSCDLGWEELCVHPISSDLCLVQLSADDMIDRDLMTVVI